MALDGVANLQQDEDTQYEQHERDAMKAVELSDLKDGTCELTNALETGLQQDIEQKNYEFMGREDMWAYFDDQVLPEWCPRKNAGDAGEETQAAYRVRVMKYLLQQVLTGSELPDGIVAWDIKADNPNLTTNDILALHYFQLLRHIPGKSKPDAICGPLTMKDLLAANGVSLTEKIKEPAESVFVKYNGRKELVPQAKLIATNGAPNWVFWDRIVLTYKVWDQYVAETTDGKLIKLNPPLSDVSATSDQKSGSWYLWFPKKNKDTKEAKPKEKGAIKNTESIDISSLFRTQEYAFDSINAYLKNNAVRILQQATSEDKIAIDSLISWNWDDLKIDFSSDGSKNLYCNLYDGYKYLWHIDPVWFATYDIKKESVVYDDKEFIKQVISLGERNLEKKAKSEDIKKYNLRVQKFTKRIYTHNFSSNRTDTEQWSTTLTTFLEKNNMGATFSINNKLYNSPEKYWVDKEWNKMFKFTLWQLTKVYRVKIDDYFDDNGIFNAKKWKNVVKAALDKEAREDAKPKNIKSEEPVV